MNDRSLQTLTRRLNRLERQVGWWKVVGSAAVGVLGFVVLIGATAQTVPGEIKANRVVIVDDAGKPRIVLGKGQEGKDDRYEISLANEKGVPTVVLYVYDFSERVTRSGLNLLGIQGKAHVELQTRSTPESDQASLDLRGEIRGIPDSLSPNKSSPEEITLAVTSRRSPSPPSAHAGEVLSAASFKLRTDHVGTGFWLDGKDALLAFHNYEGPSPLALIDKQKGNLSLGMYAGRPSLMMSDNVSTLVLGNTSLSIQSGATMQLPAASLVMFDKDGKLVWQAPR